MYCETCKVTIRGDYVHCPLCQQTLTGEPIDGVFPVLLPEKKRLRAILRLAAFTSIVLMVVCFALNVALPAYGWWSVFVIAGLVSLWLSVGTFIKKRETVLKAIVWQVVIISALAVFWDLFTGFRSWSLEFVIPIMCTAAMAAMAIITQAARLNQEDYLIYMVIDAIGGILCVLLIVFDITDIIIPALICVGCSVISLAALFIFEHQALMSELRRRLHL